MNPLPGQDHKGKKKESPQNGKEDFPDFIRTNIQSSLYFSKLKSGTTIGGWSLRKTEVFSKTTITVPVQTFN